MDCRDCARYNAEERKCTLGKVNPPRKSGVVEVVKIFGMRAICPFNDYREEVIGITVKKIRA